MAARYPDDHDADVQQATSDSNDGSEDDIDVRGPLRNRTGNMEDETDAGLQNSHPGLSDMDIIQIADLIPIDDIRPLGIKLGFEWSQVDQYLATNRADGVVSSKGTENMLYRWRERIRKADHRIQMQKALTEAGLARVAELHVLKDPLRASPMTGNEVDQCRKDLIQYYFDDACKIATSPLDPDNYVDLDKIYINLKMEVEETQTTTRKKTRKTYEDITNLPSKRVMFVGEAGVGKTTICAKMAHDWATGKHFKNIKLLILILLCEVDNHKSLGEIVKEHLSDSNDVKEKQIDEYARLNPDKVLILLDGLDEFNGKAKIIQEIIESTKLKSCQIFITARPSKVETISTNARLSKIYTRVDVEGFSKVQIKQYIQKFFLSEPEAGEALLHFIQAKGDVVAETIVQYPVYCTMLCSMWKDKNRRDVIKKFQSYFHFFDEMVYQLKEHHLSKSIGEGEELDFTRVDACFEVLGQVAFKGLVNKQMVFDKGSFGGDLALAYEVGVLSTKTKKLAPRAMRRKTGKRFLEEVFFPHKLLQEFMASIHLSVCHRQDPSQFRKILKKKLIPDYQEFRYVFYFTAPRGPDIGRDTMRLLRASKVHENLLVDTAFECQDKTMSAPITRKLLASDPAVYLTDYMNDHTVTSYLYAMDTFHDLKKLAYHKTSLSQTLSHQAALATFTAKNVHELSLSEASFHEDFFLIMADASKSSQIEKVTHRSGKVSKDDSLRYAIGLCNMPRLVELELDSVYLYPVFYGPFADPSSNCKIQKLTLIRQAFNKATFQAMLAAPSLQSLTLDRLMVLPRDEGDVPVTMATDVISHVTKLEIDDKTLLAATHELDLITLCPRVASVILRSSRAEFTNDVIDCLRLPCLTDLHLDGSTREDTYLEESTSICNSLRDRWPVLTRLTMSNILIDDAQGENILRTARQHRSLKKLRFFKCFMGSGSIYGSFYDDESKSMIERMCEDIKKEGQIDIENDTHNEEERLAYDNEEDEYGYQESSDFDEHLAVKKEFGEDDDDDDYEEEEESDDFDDDKDGDEAIGVMT